MTKSDGAAEQAGSLDVLTRLGRLVRLTLKELREILRDRRTIGTLLLMPLLVYPILSITFQRFLVSSLQPGQEAEYYVGVSSEIDGLPSDEALRQVSAALLWAERSMELAQIDRKPLPDIQWRVASDLERRVATGQLDLGIRLLGLYESNQRELPPRFEFQVIYRESAINSLAVRDAVETRLTAMNYRMLEQQLGEAGRPVRLQFRFASQGVQAASGAAFSLATFIPLILILMTITGAVYPAIDLTAGERERGTLEALVAAPVSRLSLLIAKYNAVLVVAVLTATVNLVAMTTTIYFTGLGPYLFGATGLSLRVIGQVFALMILMAGFFSAVLLALTSFARSFKEAQAYLIPLMLVAIAPGLLSLMPGVELSGILAITPLINIVLLSRDLLERGYADPMVTTIALLSTLLYGLAAISLAARIFGTDAVLYGSRGSWSDLFRRPLRPRPVANVASVMFCLAVIFPLFYLLNNLIQRLRGMELSARFAFAAGATVFLFAALPLLLARLQNVSLRSGFALRPAGPLTWIAALLWGLTLWPLAHEVFLLNSWLGIPTLEPALVDAARRLVAVLGTASPVTVVLALAITPAICEEFFFRGYLYGALSRRGSVLASIVISAMVFGGFHMVAGNLLAVERFLPSTFLGLWLGWIRHRSGSSLPGMLVHASHNGLLLLLAYYQEPVNRTLEQIQPSWAVDERGHLPALWLITALVVVGLAAAMVGWSTRVRGAPAAPDHRE